MSNENKSIHEFDFSLICEYFSSVERQGPGSAETTIKALSFVEGLTDKSLIAIWVVAQVAKRLRWRNILRGKLQALICFLILSTNSIVMPSTLTFRIE